jgi:hypothetical protein
MSRREDVAAKRDGGFFITNEPLVFNREVLALDP